MDVYAQPHLALRKLVQGRYHAGTETLAAGEVIAVPASLSVSLNLNFGEPPADLPAAYAAGPGFLYRYGAGPTPSTMGWIGLRLTPLGAYTLIGERLAELGGRVVDLADVFGVPGRVLAERCRAASGHQERFALVDEFLMACAARGQRPTAEIVRTWQLLSGSAGRVRVTRLAEEAGWSVDHLGRVFRRQVGLPPKSAARLLRLGNLLGHVEPGRSRWPQLAADHGYSDQSHLIRDMREFTGASPSAYFSRLRACGCLAAPPVAVPGRRAGGVARSRSGG